MTVIIEDSRQRKGKHEEKRQYFLDQGHIVVRQQMKWGDYGLYPSVVVDTKQDIIEIAQNLCGNISERNRFAEEMKGAKLEVILLGQEDEAVVKNYMKAGNAEGKITNLGIAFDGDADRCIAVDEFGRVMGPTLSYRDGEHEVG